MTDNIPETQWEAIARRRRELRASLGMSPIAPREILSNMVGAMTSQAMSMIQGQSQKSSDEHQAQDNNGGFKMGGFLSRFPRLQNRQPSAEPARDPNQPAEENTIEYWDWQSKNDKEPQYGTKEHDDWESRQLGYRNHMWRLKRTSLVRGSVVMDKPSRGSTVAT